MTRGIEQEMGYRYEAPEVCIVIEDDPEFDSGETHEPSDLVETEHAQEYGTTIQRYAVEDDGFYPLEGSEEMGSNLPLTLNDEQQRAVQIALSGGESTVEVLAPGGTDEIEIWSIQTFTFGSLVDGRQTFTLSAKSEERLKLQEEPEEVDLHEGLDHDSFEPSGDGMSVSASPSYNVLRSGGGSVDVVGSEGHDSGMKIVSKPRVENVLLHGEPVGQLIEVFSELNTIAVAPSGVERASLITTDTSEAGEEASAEIKLDQVAKSADSNVKLPPFVSKIEVPERVMATTSEQDEIGESVNELVVSTIAEVKGYAIADAEMLPNDLSEPQTKSADAQVEYQSQIPPKEFQQNETVYLRESAPVLPVSMITCIEEPVEVELHQRVVPSLQVEHKITETKLREGQKEQQASQTIMPEIIVDELTDRSQQETYVFPEFSRVSRKESKRGEVVRALSLEETPYRPREVVPRVTESSAWERDSLAMSNISGTGAVNVTESGDDIVISFDLPRVAQRMRGSRAKSLVV